MFNPYVMRKWASLILAGCIPTVLFAVGTIYYGVWGGVGFFLCGLILAMILGIVMLKNPFSSMLEGKGILAINLDSTGILRPFIVGVQSPYVKGKVDGQNMTDVFDRATVQQIAAPMVASKKAEMKDGKIIIELDEKTYNDGRFALYHWPVILWNAQIKSIITKDWLAEKEKDAFAEHGVLYLNRKVEELTSAVRDFGRYIVEQLKPQNMLGGKWVWIIIVGALIILGAIFAPSIINAIKGGGGAAVNAVAPAGSQAVTPITPGG